MSAYAIATIDSLLFIGSPVRLRISMAALSIDIFFCLLCKNFPKQSEGQHYNQLRAFFVGQNYLD